MQQAKYQRFTRLEQHCENRGLMRGWKGAGRRQPTLQIRPLQTLFERQDSARAAAHWLQRVVDRRSSCSWLAGGISGPGGGGRIARFCPISFRIGRGSEEVGLLLGSPAREGVHPAVGPHWQEAASPSRMLKGRRRLARMTRARVSPRRPSASAHRCAPTMD